MKVRIATPSDLQQLAKLFDGYRVYYKKESDIDGAKAFLSDRLQNDDSEIYVCETTDGNLAGFTQLYPLFSSTRMKRLWLLNDLFVDPSYRGQQVSKKLIERAKALVRATSACAMFLETEKTNMIGNNLYPKTGFQLNEASNYYEWNCN